jgi:transposase-like protein
MTQQRKEHAVKKSRFTDEQIAYALKQQELGTSVDEVCRKMGIAQATFFNWKKKYSGLGPSELRRLKQLEGQMYNESRPHGALDWLTPTEFARQCLDRQEMAATQEPKNSALEPY